MQTHHQDGLNPDATRSYQLPEGAMDSIKGIARTSSPSNDRVVVKCDGAGEVSSIEIPHPENIFCRGPLVASFADGRLLSLSQGFNMGDHRSTMPPNSLELATIDYKPFLSSVLPYLKEPEATKVREVLTDAVCEIRTIGEATVIFRPARGLYPGVVEVHRPREDNGYTWSAVTMRLEIDAAGNATFLSFDSHQISPAEVNYWLHTRSIDVDIALKAVSDSDSGREVETAMRALLEATRVPLQTQQGLRLFGITSIPNRSGHFNPQRDTQVALRTREVTRGDQIHFGPVSEKFSFVSVSPSAPGDCIAYVTGPDAGSIVTRPRTLSEHLVADGVPESIVVHPSSLRTSLAFLPEKLTWARLSDLISSGRVDFSDIRPSRFASGIPSILQENNEVSEKDTLNEQRAVAERMASLNIWVGYSSDESPDLKAVPGFFPNGYSVANYVVSLAAASASGEVVALRTEIKSEPDVRRSVGFSCGGVSSSDSVHFIQQDQEHQAGVLLSMKVNTQDPLKGELVIPLNARGAGAGTAVSYDFSPDFDTVEIRGREGESWRFSGFRIAAGPHEVTGLNTAADESYRSYTLEEFVHSQRELWFAVRSKLEEAYPASAYIFERLFSTLPDDTVGSREADHRVLVRWPALFGSAATDEGPHVVIPTHRQAGQPVWQPASLHYIEPDFGLSEAEKVRRWDTLEALGARCATVDDLASILSGRVVGFLFHYPTQATNPGVPFSLNKDGEPYFSNFSKDPFYAQFKVESWQAQALQSRGDGTRWIGNFFLISHPTGRVEVELPDETSQLIPASVDLTTLSAKLWKLYSDWGTQVNGGLILKGGMWQSVHGENFNFKPSQWRAAVDDQALYLIPNLPASVVDWLVR